MDSAIERIKAELSIARAWALLGLRGQPARDCRSPFRDDSRASFSVYSQKGWERWFDHGTAEGGDVIDLWAKAKAITVTDAITDILVSVFPQSAGQTPARAPNRAPEPSKTISRVGSGFKPLLAPWRPPSASECRALGVLRALEPGAFDLAGRLGTLKIGLMADFESWFITDPTGICAEARRLDGQLYPALGPLKERKSWCLSGSKKDWPLGLATQRPEFDALRDIVLVEGGPDYFAALSLAIEAPINFRVAAMLGAATNIGLGAEKCLRGARVIIIPHNDRSGLGEKRARLWAKEILALGARACLVQKLPIVCDDLNDFLLQRPDAGPQLLKGFHDGATPGPK